jgi:hypothetical protein
LAVLIASLLALWAKTDVAVQFFASLLAALIAAGAVIARYAYQNRLAREAEGRQRRVDRLKAASRLYGFTGYLVRALQALVVATEPESRVTTQPDGVLREEDLCVFTASKIRSTSILPTADEVENALNLATDLPTDLAHEVIAHLYSYNAELNTYRFMFIDDTVRPQRSVLASNKKLADGRIIIGRDIQKRLRTFLNVETLNR